MKPITYTAEVWGEIRRRYAAGETAGVISRSLGGAPSKVAISKRVKKELWAVTKRLSDKYPELSSGNPVIDIDKLGQNLPENRAVVIALLGQGCTYKVAAAAIGISERTLRDWREKDPAFAAKCGAARAADIANVLATIKRMSETDFQAAKFRAERDPLTRGDFAPADRVGVAIQNNYLNPLAGVAPDLMNMKPELPPIEGEVVRVGNDADE